MGSGRSSRPSTPRAAPGSTTSASTWIRRTAWKARRARGPSSPSAVASSSAVSRTPPTSARSDPAWLDTALADGHVSATNRSRSTPRTAPRCPQIL